MTRDDALEGSPQPPSNPKLLAAMRAASQHGDANPRRAIYDAFGDSALIVPILDGDEEPPRVRAVSTEEGRVVILAFTDSEALGAWAKEPVRWGSMRGRDLAPFAAENGVDSVVLNPAGPFGGELNAAELRTLAESAGLDVHDVDPSTGMASLEVSDVSQVQLDPSAEFSPTLLAAVQQALSAAPGVRSAFPLEATIGGKRSRTLGLLVDPDASVAEVAREIGAHLPADEQLDVLPLDTAMAQQIEGRVDPIWSSS